MKIPENVKTLISKYMTYLQQSTETETDAIKALEPITVVNRTDDMTFHVIGVTTDPSTNGVIIDLASNVPFADSQDGVVSSIRYKYCTVIGNEFDEQFMLFSDWQHGIYNLTVEEIINEIFKFLHPYFITSEQEWSFELSHKGAVMSIKFGGLEGYRYEKMVIRIWTTDKADITLYGRGSVSSVKIFEYDGALITMDPVQYGPLTKEVMKQLCDKVEKIMRRNSYER
jgi:hypothetical protein